MVKVSRSSTKNPSWGCLIAISGNRYERLRPLPVVGFLFTPDFIRRSSNIMNNAKKTKTSTWVILGIIIFLGIGFLYSLGGKNNNGSTASNDVSAQPTQPSVCPSDLKTFESQANALDYKQVIKDPNSFTGQTAEFKGKILQIQEQSGQGAMLLSVTNLGYGVYTNNVYITYSGHTDAVEGDIVTVYGQMSGSYTYTSQANYQLTVPSMIGCTIISAPTASAVSAPVSSPVQSTSQPVTAPSAPVVPTTPKTWHTTYTFTTSDTKQTPPFTIQGSQWRVTWSCSGDQVVTTPEIDAHSTTGSSYDTVANPTSCPSSDTTYLYDSPGTFYLTMSIYSPATITATIEDYY
jgi:hypothetical protein